MGKYIITKVSFIPVSPSLPFWRPTFPLGSTSSPHPLSPSCLLYLSPSAFLPYQVSRALQPYIIIRAYVYVNKVISFICDRCTTLCYYSTQVAYWNYEIQSFNTINACLPNDFMFLRTGIFMIRSLMMYINSTYKNIGLDWIVPVRYWIVAHERISERDDSPKRLKFALQ